MRTSPTILAAPAFALILTSCIPAPAVEPVPSSDDVVMGLGAEVTAVVDGDTIDVRTAGNKDER